MARRGWSGWPWWLSGLAAPAALLTLRAWNPESSGFQVCVLRTAFDFPCPGCGLTRAMAYLARGSFESAIALHPMAPLLAIEAALLWVAWGVLGGERLSKILAGRAEILVLIHAAPFFALWLGRAATGTLPF